MSQILWSILGGLLVGAGVVALIHALTPRVVARAVRAPHYPRAAYQPVMDAAIWQHCSWHGYMTARPHTDAPCPLSHESEYGER